MSLQKILGHSQLKTTMIYAELTIDLLLQQHRKFSPMKHFSPAQMRLVSADAAFIEAGRLGGYNSGIARREKMNASDRLIMKMIGEGMRPTEVARRLKIDRKTVYMCRQRQKLFN